MTPIDYMSTFGLRGEQWNEVYERSAYRVERNIKLLHWYQCSRVELK